MKSARWRLVEVEDVLGSLSLSIRSWVRRYVLVPAWS